MFSKYKCSGVNAKVGGPSLKLNVENCCNVIRKPDERMQAEGWKTVSVLV